MDVPYRLSDSCRCIELEDIKTDKLINTIEGLITWLSFKSIEHSRVERCREVEERKGIWTDINTIGSWAFDFSFYSRAGGLISIRWQHQRD